MKIFTLTLTSALTLLTHIVYSQGSNHALRFDGVNDYVTVNDVPSNVTGSDMTLTCWFKQNSGTSGGIIFGFNTASGGNRFLISNLSLFDGSLTPYTATITDGSWHHLAYVFNNSTNQVQVYIDGIADVSAAYPSIASGDLLSIGQEWDPGMIPSQFINGSIDEVVVWGKACTATEIKTNMCKKIDPSNPDLVAYYRIDEGADNTCSGGEDVCDLTGNGNHGTKF